MKRRFFVRRAARYFLIMLVPTVLLYVTFLFSAISDREEQLRSSGQMTLEAAMENCRITIEGVTAQNDLLTGSSRLLMAISRILTTDEISYIDSAFLYSLRTMLSSIVNSNPALEKIMIWIDDAPKALATDGSGVQFLSGMTDFTWRDTYYAMDKGEQMLLRIIPGETGKSRIMLIKRLLLKDGCVVIYINPQRWEKSMLTLLHRENEHLLILNEEKEILLHVTNDSRGQEFPSEQIAMLGSVPGESWISCEGGFYMISRMAEEDYALVAAIPQRTMMNALTDIRDTFAVILLIDLCVVMLLSWLTTRQLSSQMYHIIDMFDDAVHERPVKKPDMKRHHDESDLIMDNIVYMYLKDNALRSRMEEEILRKDNAELMALQLQINPHFLYNTLQTMDFAILSGTADKQDLSDVFHDLSGILKYPLSSPQEPVTLSDELDILRRYADIQRYRFGSRFIMYIEVDDSLLGAQVFRMMLQPLVENSMIHGLNGLQERGYIWVRAQREGDELRISVADSGVGMTEEDRLALLERINSEDSRSIGLTNLNRRLISLWTAERPADYLCSAEGNAGQLPDTLCGDGGSSAAVKKKSIVICLCMADHDTFLPSNRQIKSKREKIEALPGWDRFDTIRP